MKISKNLFHVNYKKKKLELKLVKPLRLISIINLKPTVNYTYFKQEAL